VPQSSSEAIPASSADFLFPGGVGKALVLSMDDGPVQDRRLVELLGRYGIRGTFHLNSGRLGQPGHVAPEEIPSLYAGHEVSTHSVSHPYLDSLSRPEMIAEVGDDLAALGPGRARTCLPVRGTQRHRHRGAERTRHRLCADRGPDPRFSLAR